jgi:para-aminobenzoate synthetase component 1
MYTRDQALELMNKWGKQRVPFLFVIDFEMQKIRLFKRDEEMPGNVQYSFPNFGYKKEKDKKGNHFVFQKYPSPFLSYNKLFSQVMDQILKGNTFLLNLTLPTLIETNLTFLEIYQQSRAKYKILIDNEFVCFSPETFITIKNGVISSYPMKGTIKASIPGAVEEILNNDKETAEHNTIVDLIRNDLSMVAKDVNVKRFRYIDRIKTHDDDIFQVSSEITGKLPDNYPDILGTIIFTMLPAGSVTGAPKRKTIEIIQTVEPKPRGYYTGIVGCFDGRDLDSAVMIRFIEKQDGKLWFRSGGGITHMSDPESEYQELIDKIYVPIV